MTFPSPRSPRLRVSFLVLFSVPSSEISGKGLVEQRLLQFLQRGGLPLVEVGAALGFRLAHRAASDSGAARCLTMPMMSSVTERIRPRAAGR